MLATLPSVSDFFSQVGEWSSGMFSQLWPFVKVGAGIIVGAILAVFILEMLIRGAKAGLEAIKGRKEEY